MKAVLLTLFCGGLWAQPLYVYSEFVTLDQQGKVAAPARPREILSPAIVRNAYASFQIVVDVEPSQSWWLDIGLNPENAVKVTLYRLQANGVLEPVKDPVKGKGTQVFWMDLWAASNAQTGRIKVEPQLNIDDDWMIYPMEVRVQDRVVPEIAWKPQISAPTPQKVLGAFICQPAETAPESGEGFSPEGLRYRNALQDLALAREEDKTQLQAAFGSCDPSERENPESYYSVRDLLFTHTLH